MNPKRGEVWLVEFEPARGSEIRKTRPAVVVSVADLGHLPLRLVVPVTDWKPHYADYAWIVPLVPSTSSGLSKPSGADCFQCKSFSIDRFVRKLGKVTTAEVDASVEAVAMCLGVK